MIRDSKLHNVSLAIVCALVALAWSGFSIAQTVPDSVTPEVVHVPPLGALTVKGDSTNGAFAFGNCPGISCSSSCACNTGSGTAQATSLGKVTYNLQVLSDVSGGITLPAGTGHDCTGAAALLTLTPTNGSNAVNADANGVICSTHSNQVVFTGTYVITGGTGKNAQAFGAGNISWGFTTPTVGGINNELYLTGTFAP